MAVSKQGKTRWTGTAFMIEALVLLFVLVASLAVFTSLFAYAANSSQQAKRISSASVVAQNAAEEFSADPAAVNDGQSLGTGAAQGADAFEVSCKVSAQGQGNGTLYSAHITVSDAQGEAYALDTVRYVEGVG